MERLRVWREAGLAEITFSIDSTDPEQFPRLRGGASLVVVLSHFRGVRSGLRKSIFVTLLSAANSDALPGIVDLGVEANLPAVTVTDLNFAENQELSLSHAGREINLRLGLRQARERQVLLLGPHFHDIADLRRHFRLALVRQPADLTARSPVHQHCLAPWRIAVIAADGTVIPCNCAPSTTLGNIAESGLGVIWNGAAMNTMASGDAGRQLPRLFGVSSVLRASARCRVAANFLREAGSVQNLNEAYTLALNPMGFTLR
jgi:MoaA/NifB/PqqE/SkfB family radical SAM enzyme